MRVPQHAGDAGTLALGLLPGIFELQFIPCLSLRSQRLQFDVSSPNGILLFRETSKMITTYGESLAGEIQAASVCP